MLLCEHAFIRSYNTRGRTLSYQRAIVKRFQENCLPFLSSGKMIMPVATCFPIDEVGKAHTYMQENKNIGKVVLML